jgi:hypothetical protein
MTIGYPVLNEADAAVTSSGNKVDLTAAADKFRHGPPERQVKSIYRAKDSHESHDRETVSLATERGI